MKTILIATTLLLISLFAHAEPRLWQGSQEVDDANDWIVSMDQAHWQVVLKDMAALEKYFQQAGKNSDVQIVMKTRAQMVEARAAEAKKRQSSAALNSDTNSETTESLRNPEKASAQK